MAGKYKELAEVLKQECIAPDIYSMWLQTDKIAEQAVPGQFISVYSNDGSRLLPRLILLEFIYIEIKTTNNITPKIYFNLLFIIFLFLGAIGENGP